MATSMLTRRVLPALGLVGLVGLAVLPGPGCGDETPSGARDTGGDLATDPDVADAEADPGGDAGHDAAPDAVPLGALPPCDAAPDAPLTTALGDWSVVVSPATGAWQIAAPGGATVLSGPGACVDAEGHVVSPVRLAVGAPGVMNMFGAFRIALEGADSGLTWRGLHDRAPAITATPQAVTVTWAAADGEAVGLSFAPHGEADLRVALTTDGAADGGELAFDCAAGEAFFGLGTQVTGLDLRGRTYPLWTQEQGIGKPEDGGLFPFNAAPEAAYAPMGVWHSTAGYAALVGHDAYSELDLCDAAPARGALRSYAELPSLVLVAGATPKDRVEAVTRYTGRITPPADWTFGPWNDAVGGPARLWQVADQLRAEGIPSSAIWSEDWIGGEQLSTGYRLSYAWEWDADTYPELPTDVAALHAQGFAFLAYFNPFVPTPTRMFAEGVEGGFLIRKDDGSGAPYLMHDPALTRESSMVDLTNPAAVAWLKGYLTTAADTLGIDGWMADFAEWLPVDAVLHSGEDPWRVHNRYPLDWQRANREVMTAVHADGPEPDNHWTFFARSGWASVHGGTGGLAPTMWGGDQNTDWSPHDGFPSVVPMAVHVGLSGVPIFGTDIAGYSSFDVPNTDKELFYRWTSQAALTGLMRTHHGSDECGNWAFDRDAETLAHYRRWARVHTLLLPLFRALAAEAVARGLPLVRHPWLVEPTLPALWQTSPAQYFLGDDLLVAPVLAQVTASRPVTLPGDGWWPLFGAAPTADTADAPAPPTELPVFVRPGTTLALLGQSVDSFYGATAEGVTDLDDVAGWYRLALYPDAAGATRPTPVDDATVTAAGLTTRPDFTAATANGAPLPACASAPATASCADPDGLRLVAFTGVVHLGAAQLTVTGPAPARLDVRWAGEAWGDLAAATPLTDLHPDIPPPCEEHGR